MKSKIQLIKRLFAALGLILVLSLAIGLCAGPISAYADEPEETTETTTEPPEEPSMIDTATAFFEDKILPILLSFGGVILSGIFVLPAFLRKTKKLTAALNVSNDEISRLKGIMTTYGGVEKKLAEIKTGTEYETLINKAVTAAITNALKDPLKAISDLSGDTSVINAQIESLVNAAKIVWASKDGAAKALSVAPSASALRRSQNQILKLRGILRARGDADTEKLISEVEEAANNE